MTMKLEMRKVAIYYCDFCGEQIRDGSWECRAEEGQPDRHYHSTYTSTIQKTCIDKFKEEESKVK